MRFCLSSATKYNFLGSKLITSFNASWLQREMMSPNSTIKLMPTYMCGLWLSVKISFRVVWGLLNPFKKQMLNIPHKAESESSESAVKRMCFWECLHLFWFLRVGFWLEKQLFFKLGRYPACKKWNCLHRQKDSRTTVRWTGILF